MNFLYLIYLFTLFNGGDSIDVSLSTDLEEDCNYTHANGCLTDAGIIVRNPYLYEKQGCTVLNHEIYHWLGLSESEIPYCEMDQWNMLHGLK